MNRSLPDITESATAKTDSEVNRSVSSPLYFCMGVQRIESKSLT